MANEKQVEQTQVEPAEMIAVATDEVVEETARADVTTGDDAAEIVAPEEACADLDSELATANARADENWNRVVRLQAEMDNLRKRNARELENAHKFALERIAVELLAIRDSLEGAIDAGVAEDADVTKLQEGSALILKQLTQAMEKFNIVAVDPVGEKFNPDLHQAMGMQVMPDLEPNTVVAMLQKGYTLNERLLRPALVMVSK